MMLNYSEIIDISWPISLDMTAYKNDKTVNVVATKTFERDHVRSSLITLSSHTGTHVDAPSHFLDTGKTVDALDLTALIGTCVVLDFTHCVDTITRADIEKYTIERGSIVLAKTKNSAHGAQELFDYNFVTLSADAALLLVEKKVKTFGIDYLGVERGDSRHLTHTTLLAHNVCLIEGLRLSHVAQGSYTLCCLPLFMQGLDGSPARAVLLR